MPARAEKALATERIAIDGVGLEVACFGGPQGGKADPRIVLLHEGLGSISAWGRVPAGLALATGLSVAAYSRQGYGASDPVSLPRPLDYMEREAKEVLPKVLDAIGFRAGILLGHSDGASIATLYLGGIEDHRVKGLALLAPHFFVEDVTVASISAAGKAYAIGGLRARLARHHGSNVDCAFHGWRDAWLNPGFRSWDIRQSLNYIRVPILIIQGRDDPYGTTRQIEVAEEETYCPVEKVLLSDCGHAPHRDRGSETIAAVKDLVARLETDIGQERRA
ncbi:MAG: alpha/beta hydrolase [Hyphomicrobiaceae bacterium]|nr:MAG: alpha/beta hydrolase [Hyphomicrobiaceae bacterium]